MAKGLCPPFDPQAYRAGHLTPVYFGSALNNFRVRELLAGAGENGSGAAPATRRSAADLTGRAVGHRFCLQGASEYYRPASTAPPLEFTRSRSLGQVIRA
jgi:peptide chain release factor 3